MSMTSENNSFLAEGYDFIEEGFDPTSEPLTFTEVNEDIIVESESSTPHQYKILGRAAGVFQSVGGFSRNNRRYLPEHWKIQLEKPLVQERLAQRDYMGTIGHHDHPVLDCEIAQGLVSHLLSKLEIREDASGKPYLYGEIEILDTPAGRILKAMYEGGASIFVSSRAAGKLRPVPGQTYQEVDPLNYHFEGFDVVRRAGFPVAKPVYEEVKNEKFSKSSIQEQNSVSEGVQTPQLQEQPQLNETIAKEQPKQEQSNEELQLLKGQIDKLTKILEKVVDDVYEAEEQPQEQSIEEQLGNLLLNPSVTDEAYEDVVAVLKNSNPELTSKIMENSRHKFNDEHGEKSGYKIDYYRFGGSKPYKIVPKDKSYFEASWDAPRYRTLKQAQKHILDTYKKPKEEDTNEALVNFVNLMADTNISEKAFEEIVDMISKAKKESK